MARHLTPYDTGTRLVPKPWDTHRHKLPDPHEADRYGRVDFENDEGATELTLYVESTEDGYVLHIDNYGTTVKVVQNDE